ncbi:putative nucleotidyltransferase substrate binding domain-containing protein [Sphaerotilus sp.]|uniref:putative nucleotidyltransferase substrate binding domain-containing protein n=1 Tax=Sphaerotilus sp. TaxID=2093942 RepID=UPI002ACE39A7|nr:putative nucleotidyltransferase substrate binding domain-containing protein [Sphaerotilus sp.]MDZ7857316.1 putative nucleotidyltransferase substrate binding domain-containing protein [Sphaerotilus sp.]
MNTAHAPSLYADLAEAMSRHRVFAVLDAPARAALAADMVVEQIVAGQTVLATEDHHAQLCWLLQGQAQARDPDSDAPDLLLQPGELFGAAPAGAFAATAWPVHALTAVTVARLDRDTLVRWCQQVRALQFFFPGLGREPAAAGTDANLHLSLITRPVGSLLRHPPVTLPPTATIRQAAQAMRTHRISSMLIVEQDHLFGLITDRDLRNRVVADGLDIDRPLMDIATLAPLSVEAREPAFQALLLMARHNIHHVPVVDGHRPVGMVTTTDLTEHYSTSAVYLVSDIHKQADLDGLVNAASKVRTLQRSLAAADATAYSSGHIITAITDALTSRLLQLGEARFGPAPVDYVWVAAGSQARNEQTARSDQDNCLVLDDAYDEAQHGAYFDALSRFVCDGLDACGYIHCPGEMMAMTPTWRQPRQRWAQYFRSWTAQPEPKALMLTCVFFDQRAIHGRTELLDGLRREMLASTCNNRIFLAHMVSNALGHTPPLGLFGQISPARSGEHRGTIDLKHHGIVPIVDLARVYALAGGHEAVNTHDRLVTAAESREVSEQSAHDLRDALEFLAMLRIRHQARQIEQGQAPDNFLRLDELSNLERRQLKDVFSVVAELQNVLSKRYIAGRF